MDAKGNAFYPSAETRQFLARRAGVPPAGGERLARRPVFDSRATRPAPAGETPALQPPPVQATAVVPEQAPAVKAQILPPMAESGRGIFILMAMILGVGMLTLMVQTPGGRNSSSPAP